MENYQQPDFVVASTSKSVFASETYVFPADEEGITDWGELASLAQRYGDTNWEDKDAAVAQLETDDYYYEYVKDLPSPRDQVTQALYKKVRKDNGPIYDSAGFTEADRKS